MKLKSIKVTFAALLAVPALLIGMSVFVPVNAGAACDDTLNLTTGALCAKGSGQADKLFGDGGKFTNITNAALYLIGAIAVLMLVYGGIRYTISGGDSTAVTNAKNTILYAIVGIVVAILAYAIVNFVLSAMKV